MEKGLRFIISGRDNYEGEIIFDDDCTDSLVNYQLHSKLSELSSYDDIKSWVNSVIFELGKNRAKYGPMMELYIDVEGIGTVWSTPALIQLTRKVYDADELAGIFINIIDFDGDNYTVVGITKFM